MDPSAVIPHRVGPREAGFGSTDELRGGQSAGPRAGGGAARSVVDDRRGRYPTGAVCGVGGLGAPGGTEQDARETEVTSTSSVAYVGVVSMMVWATVATSSVRKTKPVRRDRRCACGGGSER